MGPCRSTTPRPTTPPTWSSHKPDGRSRLARADRAAWRRCDFSRLAPGLLRPLPRLPGAALGHGIAPLPPDGEGGVFRRRALAHHHPGVGPVRRHGARVAGLRDAATLRRLRVARRARRAITGT